MVKDTFNRKISLLKGKINTELRNKQVVLCLEHCIPWLRDLDTKKLGAEVFEELQNEKIVEYKMAREKPNEVLERIGENRTLLNNVLHRKVN
jgi:hypothetical protein